jgi:hypothetical protein
VNDYGPAVPNVFLDAAAFVVAHQNRDEDTCQRILNSNSDDPAELITVLAQYCATAIRTKFGMTIEEWADLQAENTQRYAEGRRRGPAGQAGMGVVPTPNR